MGSPYSKPDKYRFHPHNRAYLQLCWITKEEEFPSSNEHGQGDTLNAVWTQHTVFDWRISHYWHFSSVFDVDGETISLCVKDQTI